MQLYTVPGLAQMSDENKDAGFTYQPVLDSNGTWL